MSADETLEQALAREERTGVRSSYRNKGLRPLVQIRGHEDDGDGAHGSENGHTTTAVSPSIAPPPATPSASSSSKLALLTARMIANETSPEIDWICKPWIAKGAISKLDGYLKLSGKTTLLTNMCAAILHGEPFLDWPTRLTKIIYLTEQPTVSFRLALERANLLEDDDFFVLPWKNTIGVKWSDVIEWVGQQAAALGAEVIIIDTLSRFAGVKGEAENSSGTAMEVMQPLVKLVAEKGLAVVIAWHDRKSGGEVGESGRGSSGWSQDPDQITALRHPGPGSPPNERVLLTIGRFEPITPPSVVVRYVDGKYQKVGSSEEVKRMSAREVLYNVLPTSEETAASAATLWKKVSDAHGHIPRDDIYELLKRLPMEVGSGLYSRQKTSYEVKLDALSTGKPLQRGTRPNVYWLNADEVSDKAYVRSSEAADEGVETELDGPLLGWLDDPQ